MSSSNTLIPLLFFIIPTIIYYYAKPKLTIDLYAENQQGEAFLSFEKSSHVYTVVYFVCIIFIQFAINSGLIISKCGGSVAQNIGAAGLMTLIPWIFIFGIVIAVLVLFPGFKSAFANVIGYFVVASSANTILTELLINTDISKSIDQDESAKTNVKKREELQSAADAIIKLCGNMSILINQITPVNFQDYWKMLHPLMKPQYQNNESDIAKEIKQKLLDVVVLRDNVGEALWYIYTAVLLISITQYSITSRACIQDPAAMKATQQQYQAAETAVNTQNAKAQSTTYKL